MALIIRIDVDRPYGKRPVVRHFLTRVGSDAYLPKVEAFGYLKELNLMLRMLNEKKARSYVFFRRCTLPSGPIMKLLDQGRHEIGLHLENSRSFATFAREQQRLEGHIGRKVRAVSKHGSGGAKFGYHHYAPYEPEKYVEWAQKSSMGVFFGNLEDPTLTPVSSNGCFWTYPGAFWLEPHWRDTDRFPVDWLLTEAKKSDIVMLVHPENVLDSPPLIEDFQRIISTLETKILN
ncbi:MAG: hypothetical protein ACLQU3_02425 [Limisphaerales bacterium]